MVCTGVPSLANGPDTLFKHRGAYRRRRACRVSAGLRRPRGFHMLQEKAHISRSSLLDPAEIGSSCRTTVNVQDCGGDVSLDTYMRLPVAQYSELDPTAIFPLGNSSFALRVPRIHILNVWVEPVVEVHAELQDELNRVLITANKCQIRGSDLVESLDLDRRFCMNFTNVLTWTSAPPALAAGSTPGGPPSSSNGAGSLREVGPVASSTGRPSDATFMDRITHPFGRGQTPLQGAIHGDSKLQVWVEVLGPFKFLPREVLQGTANTVLAGLMRTLLPIFTRKLAADYKRWATDAEYRQRRALKAKAPTTPTGA